MARQYHSVDQRNDPEICPSKIPAKVRVRRTREGGFYLRNSPASYFDSLFAKKSVHYTRVSDAPFIKVARTDNNNLVMSSAVANTVYVSLADSEAEW